MSQIGNRMQDSPQFPALGFVCLVVGWWGLAVGCVPSKVQVQSAPQFDPAAISSIAVVPFQKIQVPQWGYGQAQAHVRDPEEIRTQFRLPGGDQGDQSSAQRDRYSVPDTAAKFITRRIESALASRSALRVIESDQVASAVDLGGTQSGPALQTLAKDVGHRLEVDAVLMGIVRTYREREGTRIGAKPAAVGFEMFLVQPANGAVLWKGEFFEEQKPLTQDVVGFFEKSGGFVTAQELSEIGVEKVMETFPVGKSVSPVQ